MLFFEFIIHSVAEFFGSKERPLTEDRILNTQEDSVWNRKQWLKEVLRLVAIIALCFLAWFLLT
jgi:hypothetical protein